jgi:hypothetical protein
MFFPTDSGLSAYSMYALSLCEAKRKTDNTIRVAKDIKIVFNYNLKMLSGNQ